MICLVAVKSSESMAADEGQQNVTASSISSDAAVRSERSSNATHDSGSQHHIDKDVIINEKKSRSSQKRKSREMSSMSRSFELDYEEVFQKSNIPQVIAATSGKVVAWNDVFVQASGLRKSELELMTIFSFVQPERLSNFFQIVAAALKREEEDSAATTSDDAGTESSDSQGSKVGVKGKEGRSSILEPSKSNSSPALTRTEDYANITLPCIDFPGMKKLRENSAGRLDPKPLHVTVS